MTFIPGDLPGLSEAWREFYTIDDDDDGWTPVEYDLKILAHRCLVAFWMAQVMGLDPGRLVPRISFYDGQIEIEQPKGWHVFGGAPLHVQRSDPDFYPRAMAAHALWLGEELRAGRISLPGQEQHEPAESSAATRESTATQESHAGPVGSDSGDPARPADRTGAGSPKGGE